MHNKTTQILGEIKYATRGQFFLSNEKNINVIFFFFEIGTQE